MLQSTSSNTTDEEKAKSRNNCFSWFWKSIITFSNFLITLSKLSMVLLMSTLELWGLYSLLIGDTVVFWWLNLLMLSFEYLGGFYKSGPSLTNIYYDEICLLSNWVKTRILSILLARFIYKPLLLFFWCLISWNLSKLPSFGELYADVA